MAFEFSNLFQNPVETVKGFFSESEEEKRRREEEKRQAQQQETASFTRQLFTKGKEQIGKVAKEFGAGLFGEPFPESGEERKKIEESFFRGAGASLATFPIMAAGTKVISKAPKAAKIFDKSIDLFKGISPVAKAITKTTYDDRGAGIFVSTAKDVAQGFPEVGGNIVKTFKTSKPLKLLDTTLDEGKQIYQTIRSKFTSSDIITGDEIPKVAEAVSKDLQKLGYEGVNFGNEQLIFNLKHLQEGLKPKEIIPTFEEASQYIAKKIGRQPEGLPPSGIIQKGRNFLGILKEKLVDSFSPIEDTINIIERQGKFKILPTADPRLLRNRVLGSADIAKQMIKRDLEPVIKTVGSKNLDLFDQYLGARQAIDVAKRGIETGVDTKKAQIFIDNLTPQFENSANQVTNFTQKVLTYVKDGGLISEEGYKELLKRYPRYVPLNRIFDAIEEMSQVGPSKKAIASLSKQTIVQKLVGSERDIQSPLSSIINKTIDATRQVEVNRVAQSIAKLGDLPQFKDVVKPATIESKNTISTFINGQKKLFEVPEGFATAAKNLNQEATNILVKTLAIPVRTARLGFTGVNLPFIATNLVRDQLFANLTTSKVAKTSIANPYNWGKALFDVIKQGGAYDDFLASGGGWSTFFQVGRDQGKETVKQLARSTKGKIAISLLNPTKYLSALEDIVSRGEQATRTQQFRGMRQFPNIPVDPFAKPTAEVLQALKAGRETTVDFAKGGAYKNVLNSVFIYLNAGIQGSRTMVRAFQQHPVGTSMKLVSTLYIPVAAATLWDTATPERKAAYQDIDDYERNKNIIILPPNPQKDESGNYIDAIKIPLPQSFSALTIPIRTAIEHLADGNPESIPQALWETVGEVSPVDISSLGKFASRATPTAILPIVESVTNKKLFTGTPIVPRAKEELPPEMQTRFDTSALMKKAGEILNYSPAKIQNFVQSYSGSVGLQVLNAIDQGMAKAGIIKPEEVGGRGLIADLKHRFRQAGIGKIEEQFFQETKSLREEAAMRSEKEKTAAESIYNDLQNLPKDQWKPKLSELKQGGILNERIYDRIVELDKDTQAGGISKQEKSIRALAVEERSQYILKEVSKLDTEKQRAYLSELKKKRILTESVYDRLIELGYSLPSSNQ